MATAQAAVTVIHVTVTVADATITVAAMTTAAVMTTAVATDAVGAFAPLFHLLALLFSARACATFDNMSKIKTERKIREDNAYISGVTRCFVIE